MMAPSGWSGTARTVSVMVRAVLRPPRLGPLWPSCSPSTRPGTGGCWRVVGGEPGGDVQAGLVVGGGGGQVTGVRQPTQFLRVTLEDELVEFLLDNSTNKTVYCITAERFLEICRRYVRASRADALHTRVQRDIARNATAFLAACLDGCLSSKALSARLDIADTPRSATGQFAMSGRAAPLGREPPGDPITGAAGLACPQRRQIMKWRSWPAAQWRAGMDHTSFDWTYHGLPATGDARAAHPGRADNLGSL